MLSVGLRQIEYALAVAKHGSVSTAAEALSISQPAVSVAIAGLEQHLGSRLFVRRKGHPVVLTTFGRNFVSSASTLVAQFNTLLQGDELSEQTQEITIGCFEDLAPLFIGPLLADIKKSFPFVSVTVRTGDFNWLSEEMYSGRVDFSLSYNLGIDASFDTREITTFSPYILIYPDHAFSKCAKIHLKDIANEPLILVDQAHSIRHMIRLFHDRKLSPNLLHHAATFEIMRSMVSNKLGIGLSYTKSLSKTSYDGKQLRYKEIADNLTPEPIVIVSNHTNSLSSVAEKVVEHIATKSTLVG